MDTRFQSANAVTGRIRRRAAKTVRLLAAASVDAIFIVTFVCQVVRVDGFSMAPTLEDHDRLIVDRLVYEFSDPHPGDVVTLYYPPEPDKMFVKRVIATE